jgi:toxin ParE1/3/4
MKLFEIVYSDNSLADIREIFQYGYDLYGEKIAKKYVFNLDQKFILLQKMPTIGHSRPDLPIEYLCLNYEEHSIIYRIDESKSEILIIRILHSKMDFEEQF